MFYCRGDVEARPILVGEKTATDDDKKSRTGRLKIKLEKQIDTFSKKGDFMTVYSTPLDLSSYRYPEKGSPLIQVFSTTLVELAERGQLSQTDFRDIVNMAKKKMVKDYQLQMGYEDYLAKDFYLSSKGKQNNF